MGHCCLSSLPLKGICHDATEKNSNNSEYCGSTEDSQRDHQSLGSAESSSNCCLKRFVRVGSHSTKYAATSLPD